MILHHKIYRYMAVSAFNVPVTQLLLWTFNGVIGIAAIYANISAVSLAAIPAFFLYRNWVWAKSGETRGRNHIRREVLPFWATALTGLGFSTLTVWLFSNWWEGSLSVALGNILGFGIVWVGRFFIFELYLFSKKQPEASNDSH